MEGGRSYRPAREQLPRGCGAAGMEGCFGNAAPTRRRAPASSRSGRCDAPVCPAGAGRHDLLPPDLLSEFRVAYSPIAASLADGHPVSFCYAAAQTEGLWDISIKIEGKSY